MTGNEARTVMMIDDESFVLQSVAALLSTQGITVHAYESAAVAMAAYREVRPDLVLTDLNMPGLSGIGVIQKIRSFDTETPVIIITGDAELDIAAEAQRMNAFDFLLKPCEPDLLIDAVQRGIDHKLKAQAKRLVAARAQVAAIL